MEIEVVVNKEILNYKEAIFFGLSMRQFLCSASAIAIAVMVYLFFDEKLGRELASWLCILCATPVAIAGFFQYNGLTFERLLWAIFKTKVLLADRRLYHSVNYRYLLLEEAQAESAQQKKKQSIQKRWQLMKRAVFGRNRSDSGNGDERIKKASQYHHGSLRKSSRIRRISMKDQQKRTKRQNVKSEYTN